MRLPIENWWKLWFSTAIAALNYQAAINLQNMRLVSKSAVPICFQTLSKWHAVPLPQSKVTIAERNIAHRQFQLKFRNPQVSEEFLEEALLMFHLQQGTYKRKHNLTGMGSRPKRELTPLISYSPRSVVRNPTIHLTFWTPIQEKLSICIRIWASFEKHQARRIDIHSPTHRLRDSFFALSSPRFLTAWRLWSKSPCLGPTCCRLNPLKSPCCTYCIRSFPVVLGQSCWVNHKTYPNSCVGWNHVLSWSRHSKTKLECFPKLFFNLGSEIT